MNKTLRHVFGGLFGAVLIGLAGAATAQPALSWEFSTAPYKKPDFQRYCQQQYGWDAVARKQGEHVYNWQCTQGANNYPMNIVAACSDQFGSDHSPVIVGASAEDWRCTNWQQANNKVVPVIIVSANYFYNITASDSAIEVVAGVVEKVKAHYKSQMNTGKTFSLVEPIIALSLKSNQAWHDSSCLTSPVEHRNLECSSVLPVTADRGRLFWDAVNEVKAQFANKSELTNVVAPIFIFTGNEGEAFGLGAAALEWEGVKYNVQPPSVAVCDNNDTQCGLYAVGHEIGHNFGLKHTCDVQPQLETCHSSLMQSGQLLMPFEQATLNESAFFSW
ncbi:M12 family metallo-peptidase [Vibrio variabilis]|uniref:M12 family metallo-peptidase n=1 Tax=Vibrio variabilis TaxID=990271 RepID=UPI0013A697E9|nr:M12 family metallo-peptidase [Vibrio variabilis]